MHACPVDMIKFLKTYEPRREKTCLRGFRPFLGGGFRLKGPTQIGLYNHRRWLQTLNFVFRKYRDCTIYEVKTKAMISCTVTKQLIRAFVFAYAKVQFSRDAAQICL